MAPLHYAALEGNVECVELLLRHGANLNLLSSVRVVFFSNATLLK